jgi:hypothetical protein
VRLFKAKLRPLAWEPIFLAQPATHGTLTALRDALTAFARGSMLRFGLHAVLRGPTTVLRVLAGLLVPWTVLLALAPSRWFPSPWIQGGWVAFDLALVAGLFALAHRYRRGLGTALAALVTADAVLTLVETAWWNAPRARGLADAAVLAVSCAAPAVAATILWHARGARSSEA